MDQAQQLIEDRVIDFFSAMFRAIFSEPFAGQIPARLKRKAVSRLVDETADAASQSITRLFLNEQLGTGQVDAMLSSLAALGAVLELDDVSNANIAPESITESVRDRLPVPQLDGDERLESVYRVALLGIVQVLTLVGPVMGEWRKLGFAETFELLRRVVERLNRMSQQLDVLGRSGLEAADKRFELTYRDYLMQRFHRVEAGTVKMTTNLNVDLRELFVMPRVRLRKLAVGVAADSDALAMMDLSSARARFMDDSDADALGVRKEKADRACLPAIDLLAKGRRWVLIGTPGSGKSTFFEWLQIQLAAVELEHVLAGRQAIPILLRVRQLDPEHLPTGPDLIAAATASSDRAKLAPAGWASRMMEQGRVVFMLDGLDEIDPLLLTTRVLPWLKSICIRFRQCTYLISSRPSGYPSGYMRPLKFREADLSDFSPEQIAAYTVHWCVAVLLAQDVPDVEARADGEKDGAQIASGFQGHPYIRDLARNPLMLSAVCLVNFFEGGQLPADRAMLYRLCVEGLLHHWDQRRGIHSQFTLDEKLRVCRELAIAMQADDRAEYEGDKVQAIFSRVLNDEPRASLLVEHIRHRTGLLIERRPAVFAFAHLTFQEYLAAIAVHEGNRTGITVETLLEQFADPRWREVIPLYSGAGTDASARALIARLIALPNSPNRGLLLAEAYRASERGLGDDQVLRTKVLTTIAGSDLGSLPNGLSLFREDEVAPIANEWIGRRFSGPAVHTGMAFWWISEHREHLDASKLTQTIRDWMQLEIPIPLAEAIVLAHRLLSPVVLDEIKEWHTIFAVEWPEDSSDARLSCFAEAAIIGLCDRDDVPNEPSILARLLAAMNLVRHCSKPTNPAFSFGLERLVTKLRQHVRSGSTHYSRLSVALKALRTENRRLDRPKGLLSLIDALTQLASDPTALQPKKVHPEKSQ